VRSGDEIATAFNRIRSGTQALAVLGDAALVLHATTIAELALKKRLVTVGLNRTWASAGILLTYGPSFSDLYKRAATYVDKILKGAKPADLPVEQPTKFELIVNLKTAKALGFAVPPSLLARADEVIEYLRFFGTFNAARSNCKVIGVDIYQTEHAFIMLGYLPQD